MEERIETNRRNWNERTPIHVASEFYDVDGFKEGRITLSDIEIDEVGPIGSKSLLHLQCHFGMDTMSWSRLGARATGVDISDRAIEVARELNHELGLNVRFIRANIYDLPSIIDEQFDIVYTAVGVLCWLPDLSAWSQVVARCLKPGGTFYVLDDHPAARIFESVPTYGDVFDLKPLNSYFPDETGMQFPGGGHTYTGSQTIEAPSHEWQHSMSEIVNSVIGAGLKIKFIHEYPYTFFRAFPQMRRGDDGWWHLQKYGGNIPLIFSLKATK